MSQISIVIPVYNAEKTLIRCLDSIRQQAYKDFEAILIDDGSTDNSAEICKRYCEADTRFKLIKQENSGPSKARNRGIDEAVSKYLAFVDSDDYIEPNMLEEFFTAAEASSADLTVCGYYTDAGSHSSISLLKYPSGVYRGEELRRIALEAIDVGTDNNIRPYSWIRFVKRDCLENPRLRFNTDIYRSEDYLIWNILFTRIDSVCLIGDKPLYHYVLNGSSITHRYVKNYWEMSKTIYKQLKDVYRSDKDAELRLSNMLLQRATLSLSIACRAKDKETFKSDMEKVLSDKDLKLAIKAIPFKVGMAQQPSRYILFKFRLKFLIKMVFNFRYSKMH